MSPRPLLALPLLAAACDRSDPCLLVAEAGAPTLELGFGDPESFGEAAAPGATVVPERGVQGGQHLWLSLHTTGFWPGEPRGLGADRAVPVFRAELFDAATGEALAAQEWGWEAMAGDALDATLALGELFLPAPPVDEEGLPPALHPVRLGVTGIDACGTEVSAELPFSIAW